ncbi:hypothetical protein [Streptomyces sp. NPDC048106]|uniref:hypothetical protein n=1 Tax=Streptomyces sp. NPDC048106 TaxID=3155750 RepID=UPI003453D343
MLTEPAVRAARKAPQSEVVGLTGRHQAPFLESHEQAAVEEFSFLVEHLKPRDPARVRYP